MIERGIPILLAILPAAVEAALSRRISAGEVAAVANRCGLRGLTVRRDGPRRFLMEQVAGETTVTVEQAPILPERERRMQAEAEAAMRPWNCLERWGRQRHVTILWALPPIIMD